MSEDVKKLKQQIEDLKSELVAEKERKASVSKPSLPQRAKNRVKRSALWQVADNPDSKMGKVIRSPRTVYRILTNPSVVSDIRKKNGHVKKTKKDKKKDIFVPIKFFFSEDVQKRVNVVLEELDLELIRMGISLANEEKIEVRIITTKEKFDPVIYREMIKTKKIPKADNISFYDAVEQYGRAKVFELEVSKGDVFLTKAWDKNDKS